MTIKIAKKYTEDVKSTQSICQSTLMLQAKAINTTDSC